LIFVTGVDNWGIQGVDLPTDTVELDDQAYRVTPLLSSPSSTGKELLLFNRLFLERYKTPTADSISYMTFLTVMSALTALEKFPEKNANLTMHEKVLMSFRKALIADPNWFRSKKYAVYQYTDKGEVLVDTIMLPKYESKF
jgi:hypothetical protein